MLMTRELSKPLILFNFTKKTPFFQVLQSKVTMGMGSRNPIHNVTFYNKEGQIENVKNLITHLPDYLNFKTFNIICKNNEKCALKEATRFISKCIPEEETQFKLNGHNGQNGH